MPHIYTSTVADGSMKSIHEGDIAAVNTARSRFLQAHHIAPNDTTLVRLTYHSDNYRRYFTVTDSQRGDGIIRPSTLTSDALVTTSPGHALFLPLADCIGAVIHDPVRQVLTLSHLGRHNLEQGGGSASIDYLVRTHGVTPAQLTVWLSPAAGSTHYPLHTFGGRSLHEVATEQLLAAGVRPANITTSPIDTTIDHTYYSHSEFKKGHRPEDGRFAVVAVLR